jgi:hypothetical protein
LKRLPHSFLHLFGLNHLTAAASLPHPRGALIHWNHSSAGPSSWELGSRQFAKTHFPELHSSPLAPARLGEARTLSPWRGSFQMCPSWAGCASFLRSRCRRKTRRPAHIPNRKALWLLRVLCSRFKPPRASLAYARGYTASAIPYTIRRRSAGCGARSASSQITRSIIEVGNSTIRVSRAGFSACSLLDGRAGR